MPIALVPAPPSLHRVPSAKFIESAARIRTLGLPSTQSRMPLASLTTIRWPDSSALAARQDRISGAISASGWISQRAEVSSASATTGAIREPDGSTPAAAERRHDATIGSRTEGDSRRPENCCQPPPMKLSQARRISLARWAGTVATSMASHGFDMPTAVYAIPEGPRKRS